MNIPTLTYSGKVVVRPDQTYRHGQDSLYVPEFVDSISWSPAAFLHVCKPGRCVGARFASRYYDGISYGILLYPENLIDGSIEGYASAICLNGTTYFPDFGTGEADACLSAVSGGKVIWSGAVPARDSLDTAVARITSFCHIRTGDVLAIELAGRSALCKRGGGGSGLTLGKLSLSVVF